MTTDELPDDRDIDILLSSLDEPAPVIDYDVLLERAHRRPGRMAPHLRRAASIAAALAVAGAAYAAPSSPLPRWLEQVGRALTGRSETPAATIRSADSVGVVLELDGPLDVVLESDAPGGFARVSLSEGDSVEARAAAGSARFMSEPERLRIVHQGGDTLDLVIPREGPRVGILVGARTVFVRERGEVLTTAPRDARGGWLISLDPGPS